MASPPACGGLVLELETIGIRSCQGQLERQLGVEREMPMGFRARGEEVRRHGGEATATERNRVSSRL